MDDIMLDVYAYLTRRIISNLELVDRRFRHLISLLRKPFVVFFVKIGQG